MKRFRALVAAAAALAVWTVPALAEVKFTGEYRLRAESMSETDFRDDRQGNHSNQAFYGQRVRLTGVGAVGDDASVKITIQDTRTWGQTDSITLTDAGCTTTTTLTMNEVITGLDWNGDGDAVDAAATRTFTDTNACNTTDLHEAFLQINKFFGTPITLKAGRQELVYGDQRLVGAFGWSNNGRSFDALKLMYSNDTVNVDAFTAKVDENNLAAGDSADDIDFYGVYATVKSIPNNTIDVYGLLLKDGGAGLPGVFKSERNTYGVRLAGKAVGFDYTAEYAMQSGTVDLTATTDANIDASAYAVKAGFTIPNTPGLRIGAEYDYASGDDDSTDDKRKTFNQLYPTNHDKYGFMDQQGWQNMKAWNVNVSAKPTAKLGVRVDYWSFALADNADGWYKADGTATAGTVRGAGCTTLSGSDCDAKIGAEVDITLNYKYSDTIAIQAGVSRFMPGVGLEERVQLVAGGGMIPDTTADTENMDWMFVQLTANF